MPNRRQAIVNEGPSLLTHICAARNQSDNRRGSWHEIANEVTSNHVLPWADRVLVSTEPILSSALYSAETCPFSRKGFRKWSYSQMGPTTNRVGFFLIKSLFGEDLALLIL